MVSRKLELLLQSIGEAESVNDAEDARDYPICGEG
jgi:hypothetical protein